MSEKAHAPTTRWEEHDSKGIAAQATGQDTQQDKTLVQTTEQRTLTSANDYRGGGNSELEAAIRTKWYGKDVLRGRKPIGLHGRMNVDVPGATPCPESYRGRPAGVESHVHHGQQRPQSQDSHDAEADHSTMHRAQR